MASVRDPALPEGIHFHEYGVTAMDAYHRRAAGPVRFLLAECGVIDLAKAFEGLEYPGLPYADATLPARPDAPPGSLAGTELRFLCADSARVPARTCGAAFRFTRDLATGFFHDPEGIYPLLKAGAYPAPDPSGENGLFEAAILASRCGTAEGAPPPGAYRLPTAPSALYQKDLLTLILVGRCPDLGLELLKSAGFVDRFWPELAQLGTVDHAKDHHPEGGGWAHTMETFSHRKTQDLALSLALLLHDTGKAKSQSVEGRRFDRHAEIGASIAARFMDRLGFSGAVARDVLYMVRWHMLPAALPRLPPDGVKDIVADARFPTLLELYRCDEFSTFKGPDSYYEACAAYRTFLKNERNPYRDSSGRKLGPPSSRPAIGL